jgi:hypothetical protein
MVEVVAKPTSIKFDMQPSKARHMDLSMILDYTVPHKS